MGLSSFASKPIEEVAAANSNVFFQMYWVGTRDKLLARAELGDQVEVLLDGGIRRGGDVVKALALGRG
jgi:isopentenyl diphosphate isomerase/L-lactate dehydrogenase-like FMN-dependent dehydrogenase